MEYAVTSSEMKSYDRNTSEFFGVDSAVLMERASLCVADEIDRWRSERNAHRKFKVLVLAGYGNNGGDGICIARLLFQRGYTVLICMVGDATGASDLVLKQLSIAEKYNIPKSNFPGVCRDDRIPEFDIIVDAIFGIGLSRPVSGDQRLAVEYITKCKDERKEDLFVVSVDIPTGISADTGKVMGCAVRADMTVTFNRVKIGQIMYPGCEYTGQLLVRDAGITDESFLGKEPSAFFYNNADAKELLENRRKDSNKGTNGKVLIIAGSKEISGAAVLAASACLKSGAGMVRVFTAAENAEAIKTLLPEALLDTYDNFEPVREKLIHAFEWSTQAVAGPGLGTEGKGEEILEIVLSEYDKSLILDADALNIIAGDEHYRRLAQNYATGGKKLIMTPHMGEFARLINRSVKECAENFAKYPRELATRFHSTIVCKDARTIVADSNEKKIYINVSGNDGMATAGSGDVLSGILGALLSQKMTGFDIAAAGTYIHGMAGDIAAAEKGRYSMVASDIVAAISQVL